MKIPDSSESMGKGETALKIIFWILAVLMIIAAVAVMFYKPILDKYVIDNSDLTNSMFQRKLFEIKILPLKLAIAGIASALGYLIMLKKRSIIAWMGKRQKKIDSKVLFGIALGLIVVLNLIAGVYLMQHQRIGGQDEGFHINNAKLISQGKLPYVDFIYYKGHVFGYIQSLLMMPFGYNLGVERAISLVLKFVLLGLAFEVTRRLTNKWGGLLVTAALTFQISVMSQFTIIDTAGHITTILLLLSVLFLQLKIRPWLQAVLSMLFMCLAIGTRLFVAPLAIVLLAYLYLNNKNLNSKNKYTNKNTVIKKISNKTTKPKQRTTLYALLTGIVFVAAAYIPFFVLSPKRTYYGLLGWILERTSTVPLQETVDYFFVKISMNTLVGILLDKIIVLILYLLHNWSVYAIALFATWKLMQAHARSKSRARFFLQEKLLATYILISFVVLLLVTLTPTPGAYNYIFQYIPLLTVGATALLFYWMQSISFRTKVYASILVLCVLLIAPITQYPQMNLEIRDSKPINTLDDLHHLSDFVKHQIHEGDYVLAFEIPVIVEAGGTVVPGLERGYFTYLTTLPTDEVRELKAMNTELYVQNIMQQTAGVVVMSKDRTYDVLGLLPEEEQDLIYETLDENYELVKTFPEISDWGYVDVYLTKQ
ncbi:glycosyltransferase family 39 protein [Candidatus Woesearchaeota archaeon]|nr:glycosyltransferase family 39 protein [Candidatus Woesearchaeota archaeon]